ncbi:MULTISPECIES: energy-coupling factor transporter transmembrane component T [Dermabacteraceae]|uniref:Energy-coupling factor transport system permease protein n=1 Tax=Helcobacillus massiliensis TaxID=521392 RepID=A0A839QUU5_9MICO|nr:MULTISPECIES: energy-coupling factor transporter transmembrane component T [Dermabacteraceae]MBB3023852.1 energy-coupling factor transport system permease protein [Helcobacillus massiliensis]MCT2332508.1 energy-coupling factor transporter transmembrane protein EcfT [Helcobacillus massiliensis]MDK7741401.1 energy-coupling factor transporter transmembrane component T [Helcobacillus massiliensis]WOO92752.1 energy-coupling factor transporter transmembrane component T [Helcobacillus massiliensis]
MPDWPDVFDVRSLVFTVVTLDALVLAALPRRIDLLALAVLMLLLLAYRLWRQLLALVALAVVLLGAAWLLRLGSGPVVGALGIAVLYLWRYSLAGAFGWFLITRVRPTEFMAAMTRMRIPQFLAVPIAVVLRFVPTVLTEGRAIIDAMRMRGLLGGPLSVLRHPIRTAEYLVIPMLAGAVRAGDELTASALCRGFGSPGRRTTIVQLHFGVADVALMLVTVAVAAYGFGVGLR